MKESNSSFGHPELPIFSIQNLINVIIINLILFNVFNAFMEVI